MISRVADCCFWFGRYLERAESTSRALSVARLLALDGGLPADHVWGPLLLVSGEEPAFVERFGRASTADGELVQRHLVWDPANPSSLRGSVAAARDNVRSAREVLSAELWQTVNVLHLHLAGADGPAAFEADRHAFYEWVRERCQLATGLAHQMLLHDEPLQFFELGAQLERVSQMARLLDVHHHALVAAAKEEVLATTLWMTLLRASSGHGPFMRSSRGTVTGASVAAFLVAEPRFPRSLRFCLAEARLRLALLCPADRSHPGHAALARLGAIEAELAAFGGPWEGPPLHALLTHIVDAAGGVCEDVGRAFLGAAPLRPAQAQLQHAG